jgi:hypothetical protein
MPSWSGLVGSDTETASLDRFLSRVGMIVEEVAVAPAAVEEESTVRRWMKV